MNSRKIEAARPHRLRLAGSIATLAFCVAWITLAVAQNNNPDPLGPAKTAISRGQFSIAKNRLTLVIESGALSGRHLAEAYFYRGGTLQRLNRFGEALADYSNAIEIEPRLAPAYMDRGITYYWLGHYARAVTDYSRAISLRPDYDLAYINRGNALQKLDAFELAERDYSGAISINSEAALAYSGRAAARYRQHQFKLAIVDYNRALTFNQRDTNAIWGRAFAMYNLGQSTAAAMDFATLTAGPAGQLYAALWYYISLQNTGAQQKNGQESDRQQLSLSELARAAANTPSAGWPQPLADFLLGRSNRQTTLAQAFSVDPGIRRHRLAEVYFTLAISAYYDPESGEADFRNAANLGGSAYADPVIIDLYLTRLSTRLSTLLSK